MDGAVDRVPFRAPQASGAGCDSAAAQRCFSAQLQHSFNQLTQEFLGRTLVEDYTKPTEYTGKLSELSNMTLLPPCAVLSCQSAVTSLCVCVVQGSSSG